MARALFFSIPMHGHTNPTLPLVRELVARGDEVIYYSTPSFTAAIENTGAQFRSYRNSFCDDFTGLPEQMNRFNFNIMRVTSELLEAHLDNIRLLNADYIIADNFAPWGRWFGLILGIPVVTSTSTFAFNRNLLLYGFRNGLRPAEAGGFASKVINEFKAGAVRRQLKREYKVNGPVLLQTMFGSPDLNIVYTSRDFQPCAATFGDHYHFCGPFLAERPGKPDFPWHEVHQKTLIYISFGTLFPASQAFFSACFEAFRNEDCQVILSTAGASTPAPPPNFIVRKSVPQLDVLQRASAFITHGGMNSVSESFSYGVPVVAVPQMGEQEMVAARLQELGTGIRLKKKAVTAELLRESVKKLLINPSYRQKAIAIGDSFRSAGGPGAAADAIHALTDKRQIRGR